MAEGKDSRLKTAFQLVNNWFSNRDKTVQQQKSISTQQQPNYSQPINKNYGNGLYRKEQERNVIDTAESEQEKAMKILQLKQEKLLSQQWYKANYDIGVKTAATINDVKLMYRDADLMDCMPEIATSLEITSEDTCKPFENGNIIKIESKSSRIKAILEDLFINRLQVNMILPMIARATEKYGNEYMLLNFDQERGIIGWRELPVYDIERFENGASCNYETDGIIAKNTLPDFTRTGETWFSWLGSTQMSAFRSWQIAHFRQLNNSIMLPYGVSSLNKGRRHFRMLSMMEDAMLLYRMDKSVERRVYKVNVGSIDDGDVQALIEDIASNFKRSYSVDPKTGQLDLKANFLSQNSDYFIPFREGAESKIESLPSASNPTQMDDIKYVQNKVFTAIRTPKEFINFESPQGDGKNLPLIDARFATKLRRLQQYIILELNKVAQIHLLLLGFADDLTNFTITMKNPSNQTEMLEIESMGKKIQVAKDACSDVGGGIPLCSLQWAWKHIMKWSDNEIAQNLNQLRLEKALSTELENTMSIIKRTGLFNPTDNLYGVPGADYPEGQGGEQQNDGGPMGGGGGGFGGGLDFSGGDAMGTEGDMPMDDAMGAETGGPDMPPPSNNEGGPNESLKISKPLLTESRKKHNSKKKITEQTASIPLYDKHFIINDEINKMIDNLSECIQKGEANSKQTIDKQNVEKDILNS